MTPLRGSFFHAAAHSPDAVVVVGTAGLIDFANSRVEALLGYLPNELLGRPLSVLIPERFRAAHVTHLAGFMNNLSSRMMGAGLKLAALRKGGDEFLVEISLSPYRAPDGIVVIAAMRDITNKDLKKDVLESENSELRDLLGEARTDVARLLTQAGISATEHETATRLQRLLLGEVHHRMKNMLLTVVAITSQSLRTAESLEHGRLAVVSRLTAMGRAQNFLLQTNEAVAQLADVLNAAIEPFESADVPRFAVEGSLIEIGLGAVLPITLSLNELCTNAVKYGALSNTAGRVEISSSVDEASQLFTLKWVETGGPPVQEPTRHSFGTRLLGAMAAQLHGEVRLRYEPGGVNYQLNIPLALLRALRST
ncbi:MAG: HWE histidine kinase domain-containing protein [bacterium]|nr:HWE histidine kinase domain-containing protein [bacterium]